MARANDTRRRAVVDRRSSAHRNADRKTENIAGSTALRAERRHMQTRRHSTARGVDDGRTSSLPMNSGRGDDPWQECLTVGLSILGMLFLASDAIGSNLSTSSNRELISLTGNDWLRKRASSKRGNSLGDSLSVRCCNSAYTKRVCGTGGVAECTTRRGFRASTFAA